MAVYIKCSACGGEHRSMIQLDKASFENPSNSIEGNSETCPKTQKQVTASKKAGTVFWKDDPKKN